MNTSPHVVFITLNWNTTELLTTMVRSIEATTAEPHSWVIVDNGSHEAERDALYAFVQAEFRGGYGVFTDRRDSWGAPGVRAAVIRLEENVGCVRGHNLAFDFAAAAMRDEPFEIVMVDTDVELHESGWLETARTWADGKPIGILGMEHAQGEVCAPAVFLDPSGNWYIHQVQTQRAAPTRGESVGLGLALIRWPVLQAGLRFDDGYELYYKQDDDLCFQARADLGLEVWTYPVRCVHWGSGSLKANDYDVAGHHGWDAFHDVKRKNQKYFADKWAWALRSRRADLAEEQRHLDDMAKLMAEHRSEVNRE